MIRPRLVQPAVGQRIDDLIVEGIVVDVPLLIGNPVCLVRQVVSLKELIPREAGGGTERVENGGERLARAGVGQLAAEWWEERMGIRSSALRHACQQLRPREECRDFRDEHIVRRNQRHPLLFRQGQVDAVIDRMLEAQRHVPGRFHQAGLIV